MTLRKFVKDQRVRFVGKPDEALPNLSIGDEGTVWSHGVGKTWVWVVFDSHERPLAVHRNEVEFMD
jgi:hypothetical protein